MMRLYGDYLDTLPHISYHCLLLVDNRMMNQCQHLNCNLFRCLDKNLQWEGRPKICAMHIQPPPPAHPPLEKGNNSINVHKGLKLRQLGCANLSEQFLRFISVKSCVQCVHSGVWFERQWGSYTTLNAWHLTLTS